MKVENAVNKVVSFMCENIKKNNWSSIKNATSFLIDFQTNKRCVKYSLIRYDYQFRKNIKVLETEIVLLRECFLKFIEKYKVDNFTDVLLTNTNIGISIIFLSYDNILSENNINTFIQNLEKEINDFYGGNIFSSISSIIDLFPKSDIIANLKTLEKLISDGTYSTNLDNNEILNLSQLKNIIWNKISPTFHEPQIDNSPYEPYEPAYPAEPAQPSEPSDTGYIVLNNKVLNTNFEPMKRDINTLNDDEIREAICKILEITTTEGTTTVGN